MKKDPQLYAPESYWSASPEVRAQVVNGCGTSGWKGALIPETIWFLSVKAACNIHDWMYTVGLTLADKAEADRVFLNNMLRIIEAAGGCSLLQRMRRVRAREYYEAVHLFGGPAFWDGKNQEGTMAPALAPIPNRMGADAAVTAAVVLSLLLGGCVTNNITGNGNHVNMEVPKNITTSPDISIPATLLP